MRSRYSAYVLELTRYLIDSWHSSNRPKNLTLADNPHWLSLDVLATSIDNDSGTVHFKAHYQNGRVTDYLEEKSRFVRERGRWYYVDGQIL